MKDSLPSHLPHPRGLHRRAALQAGTLGLLHLGLGDLASLGTLGATTDRSRHRKSCIYIFLSGGLGQHDSFDMKPNAPAEIRGEFRPIATRTPGLQIVEHLPKLAQRSQHWALLRSLTHNTNSHSDGHFYMLTGRSTLPVGYNPNKPQPTDFPAMAAVAGHLLPTRGKLPSAVVLPEKLVHTTGRTLPGQFAGIMGPHRDPWFVEASPFDSRAYGAYPTFEFDHQQRSLPTARRTWQQPGLWLPHEVGAFRMNDRLALLRILDQQRRQLDQSAELGRYDVQHSKAVSLLTDRHVREAFDITRSDPKVLVRYGRNSFGYSLLMARRLVEAGVHLVQVNLGNNETWDTHGEMYPHLKDKLFPPTDRALAALLDDLHDSGLLDSTLLVMAGEFGRTPRISHLPQFYKFPGRDHWGAVQTVWFAGGGVRGGTVVGATDKQGAYPAAAPQRPENMAATIYDSLGLPDTTAWFDETGRPHHIYYGTPIGGLT
ncbi:MAG: DUF1501 domain-containing protein [Planctomycetaceae bacterium]